MDFVDPRVVVSQFHLRAGDRVAELGCGVGHYLPPLARAVGANGRVFGVEIQRNVAEAAADLIRKERIGNAETIWGDLESLGGTKIKDESLDVALFSNTLSMLEDRSTALDEAKRILRKGGKLMLIDWSGAWGGMGPAPHMVVTEDDAKALAEGKGFSFERAFPAGGHHYGLAFRK